MTWKSYAFVSSVTVLAGWLASTPPGGAPESAAVVDRAPASSEGLAPSGIEIEAARLEARVREEIEYREPERNPFRFGARPAAPAPAPDAAARPLPETPVVPPPPPITLSGIAENRTGETTERTAVLNGPSGVLLVREGDEVLGQYRVGRIESEAVELVDLADGTTVRLAF